MSLVSPADIHRKSSEAIKYSFKCFFFIPAWEITAIFGCECEADRDFWETDSISTQL